MRKHLLKFSFLIFNFSFLICFGQDVVIKGKADTTYLSQADKIYAFTYEDYISYREKELASSSLDAKGNFNLSFSISQPTAIFLMIRNVRAEMVVEPNKMYDINFLKKDSNAIETLSIPISVEIEFNNSDSAELNYLIADFTNRYEAFLEYHRPLITKKNQAIFGKIDTMKTLSKKKYSSFSNSYLNNYIDYTFASLEESIALKGDRKIFEKYIAGKPIQFQNQDYMKFFNQFFAHTVKFFMNSDKASVEINSKQNFSSLMEYFKQSELLTNDTIREAVILKSMAEYFEYPACKVNSVLAILEQASTQCKAKENKIAAENLKKKLSVMIIGKPASSFSLQDKDGKPVSLADFKGKYVYVNFWTTWCSSCTQEMMLIPELKKIYGGKITFVSVSVDKKIETMKNFLKKNPKLDPDKNGAGWTFLYCDNYKNAKNEFNVLTVPTYFLIDPKGNVLKSPADKPQDIEPTFDNIKKKK